MGPFQENAFYLLAWRAFLVALITLAVMITHSFELAAAFLIGANVALLFSLGLIVWSAWLSEERIVRTEAWRCFEAKPTAGGSGWPQLGAQLPPRGDVTLRSGRIGFGDCLVCIRARAREPVAAVAAQTL